MVNFLVGFLSGSVIVAVLAYHDFHRPFEPSVFRAYVRFGAIFACACDLRFVISIFILDPNTDFWYIRQVVLIQHLRDLYSRTTIR